MSKSYSLGKSRTNLGTQNQSVVSPFFHFTQVKGQHHDFLVEDKARADERKEIIDVVQDMIEHHDKLFEVTPAIHLINKAADPRTIVFTCNATRFCEIIMLSLCPQARSEKIFSWRIILNRFSFDGRHVTSMM